MMNLKSLMVAMLLAVPVLTFAQVEATDNDDEFDVTFDNNKTTNTTKKVSNRNATTKKTTTTVADVDTLVIEEVEVIDDGKTTATPVTTVTDDFDNAAVPTEIVIPDKNAINEVATPQVSSVQAVGPTAPAQKNYQTETIGDVTVPENMFALDSLLNLYMNQTYLTVDAECNLPNTNPEYDEQTYIDRLSKLPTVMEMPYNNVVRQMIDRYTIRNRRGVSAMLATQNLYMPIFEEALEAYGLPLELKYLPIIESGLNPTAVSRAGATGLWQFMPGTAKTYGLKINSLVDERCDPIKSSYAAAKLLYDSYKVFGDWNLVIAAYNCGPGNVQKAIHRAGGVYDYWKIYPYLPKETRGYVPAFIAANYIMNYYCEHNICPMLSRLPESTDTVVVTKDLRFETISKVVGIPVKQIEELNPQYRKDIVNGGTEPSVLRLPARYITAFVDNESAIYNGSAPYKRATVTPGYTGTDSSYTPAENRRETPTATASQGETVDGGNTLATTDTSTSTTSRRRYAYGDENMTSTSTQPATATTSKYSSRTRQNNTSESHSSSKYDKKDSSRDSSKKEASSSRHSSKSESTKSRDKDDEKDSKKDSKSSRDKDKKESSSKDKKESSRSSKDKKESSSKDKKESSRSSKDKKESSSSKSKSSSKKDSEKKSSSSSSSHTVKNGETLSHIAARNGMTVTELKKKNPKIKGDMIHPGDKVRVK